MPITGTVRDLALVALTLALAACRGNDSGGDSSPVRDDDASVRESTVWSGAIDGVEAEVHIPADWNGTLVIHARGLLGSAQPAVVAPPFAEELLDEGYAWAASAFSGSIFDPAQAAEESLALRDFVVASYGPVDATYIVGQSMGGAAAMIAAETTPDSYAGALALCSTAGFSSFMAGTADLFAATLDVAGVDEASLGDPVSPDELVDIWDGLSPTEREAIVSRMVSISGGRPEDVRPGFEAVLDGRWDTLIALASVGQLALTASADRRLHEYRPHAGAGVTTVFATGGTDIAGSFGIPVLTVHNTGDGIVLFREAETIYARAAESHRSEYLVQRAVRATRHCDFTQREFFDAFEALQSWVETGVRPDGDDLHNGLPATFGDQFTDPSRGFGG